MKTEPHKLELLHRSLPQVAIVLQMSLKVCRDMFDGIMEFERLYGPWRLHVIEGRHGEQNIVRMRNSKERFGIIAFSESRENIDIVRKARSPSVLIDPSEEDCSIFNGRNGHLFGVVRCQTYSVGEMGARYFLERQFNHFAWVGDVQEFKWSIGRREGFIDTIRNAGFDCQVYPGLSQREQENRDLESRRLCRWIRKLPKPIALMAARDVRARQILDACISEGISVPHQVAVLGVDNDEPLCRMTYPPLSSIQMETKRAGYLAAELLQQMTTSANKETDRERTRTYNPSCVVTRTSSDSLCVTDKWVAESLDYIRLHTGQYFGVSDIVKFLGISRRQLEYRFQKSLHRTVLQEIHRFQLQRVCSLLLESDLTIAEIAPLCGFDNEGYLGKVFRKYYKQTMSEFRRRNCAFAQRSQES